MLSYCSLSVGCVPPPKPHQNQMLDLTSAHNGSPPIAPHALQPLHPPPFTSGSTKPRGQCAIIDVSQSRARLHTAASM